MERAVVFRGADLEVSVSSIDGPVAVVSFSNYAVGPRHPFGDGFLQKCGFFSVFVIAQSNHWWQSDEAPEAMALVRGLIAHAPRRVSYGNSMGGFGAMAWAKGVDATHVCVVAPQTTIADPAAPLHDAWRDAISERKIITANVVEGLGDIVPSVIYDPSSSIDQAHIDWLEARAQVRRLIAPFAGHAALNALKDGGILTRSMRDLLGGRPGASFRGRVRESRHRSATYLGNAAWIALRQKHIPMALGLSARFAAAKPGPRLEPDYERMHQALTRALNARHLQWSDVYASAAKATPSKTA